MEADTLFKTSMGDIIVSHVGDYDFRAMFIGNKKFREYGHGSTPRKAIEKLIGYFGKGLRPETNLPKHKN